MKKLNFFRKFNIIDFFAALLIIAAVLVSGYYYTKEDGLFSKQQFEIEYTIRIDMIENEFLGNLSNNDVIYDLSTAFPMGKITDIKTRPSDQYYSSMDLVIVAVAEVHNGVISVSGVDIFTGKWIDFRTPDIVHGGNCVSVMINDKIGDKK